MANKATFETPDGDDVEIDADDFAGMRAGDEPETTIIELEDGEEVVVVATELEVAAELGVNPLDYIDPEDDDESVEALVEGDTDPDDTVDDAE